MNNDLISRQKVIRAFLDLHEDYISIHKISTILDALPSSEKSRWVRRKNSDCYECPKCKAVLEEDDIKAHNFYYCYHCGADMRTIDGRVNIER